MLPRLRPVRGEGRSCRKLTPERGRFKGSPWKGRMPVRGKRGARREKKKSEFKGESREKKKEVSKTCRVASGGDKLTPLNQEGDG